MLFDFLSFYFLSTPFSIYNYPFYLAMQLQHFLLILLLFIVILTSFQRIKLTYTRLFCILLYTLIFLKFNFYMKNTKYSDTRERTVVKRQSFVFFQIIEHCVLSLYCMQASIFLNYGRYKLLHWHCFHL